MEVSAIPNLPKNNFVRATDLFYGGILKSLKKSNHNFQAFWESMTNSLEAIQSLPFKSEGAYIAIRLLFENDIDKVVFKGFELEDSGIGFNDENFARFLTFKDDRKSANNKGCGRFQLLQTFKKTDYVSFFRQNDQIYKRTFWLSQSPLAQNINAVVYYEDTVESPQESIRTILTAKDLKEPDEAYQNLTSDKLKEFILSHYMKHSVFPEPVPVVTTKCFFCSTMARIAFS